MAPYRLYDPSGQEVHEPQMIWADRLAIALWLFFGGLIGLVYLAWGAPGAFKVYEEVIGCLVVAIWFAARVLDFLFTGRIRYSGT